MTSRPTVPLLVGHVELDEEGILLADGFEDAFVGVAARFGLGPVAVYDTERCIEIMMTRDGSTVEEAIEHLTVNMLGTWAGDQTPIYVTGCRLADLTD